MKQALWAVALVIALTGAWAGMTYAADGTDGATTRAVRFSADDADFEAADCCRVIVKGCDKTAKVCLPGACNLDNQKKAREAFEKAYSCKSTSVSSYIGTCSGEKCDIDLR